MGESRGKENQPKHSPPGAKSKIVLWEQDSHRDASRANKKKGFTNATPGTHWQSHHIICISSMGSRDNTRIKLEQGLYITEWNINEKPNMIGLPQKCQFRESYGGAEDETKKNAAAGKVAWSKVAPKNWPAHNVDHPLYTEEVTTYLEDEIWSQFDEAKGDHAADAEWLKKRLTETSEHFETVLHDRGKRPPGTVNGWKNRFPLSKATQSGQPGPGWQDPFSMAETPTERNPGRSIGDLTEIFKMMG
jgi:hypothetical protein